MKHQITKIHEEGFIHSFIHSLACAECDDSLLFFGASSIPFCCVRFHFVLPSISWSPSQPLMVDEESLVSQNVLIHTQISMCPVLFLPMEVTFLQGHNSTLLVSQFARYKSVQLLSLHAQQTHILKQSICEDENKKKNT